MSDYRVPYKFWYGPPFKKQLDPKRSVHWLMKKNTKNVRTPPDRIFWIHAWIYVQFWTQYVQWCWLVHVAVSRALDQGQGQSVLMIHTQSWTLETPNELFDTWSISVQSLERNRLRHQFVWTQLLAECHILSFVLVLLLDEIDGVRHQDFRLFWWWIDTHLLRS